jgi:hypothetical protein
MRQTQKGDLKGDSRKEENKMQKGALEGTHAERRLDLIEEGML